VVNENNKIIQNLIKNQTSVLADKFKSDVSRYGVNENRFYTSRMVRVMVITWNVGGFKPPSYKEISSMFSTVGEDKPDIIVVGRHTF
jgi:hypothetical protein